MSLSTDLGIIIGNNSLFSGLTLLEREKLSNIMHKLKVQKNKTFLPLRIVADTIFIVCRGELSAHIPKKEGADKVVTRTIGAGEIWYGGELKEECDSIEEKISIKSTPRAIVMVLRLSDLFYQIEFRKIYEKIAQNLGTRAIKSSRGTDLAHIYVHSFNQEELNLKIRAMQYFVTTVLLMLCLYIFFLHMMEVFAAYQGTVFPITITFALIALMGCIWMIRSSHLPAAALGLTLTNTRVAVKEALIGAVPLLFMAVLFKFIVVHTIPSFYGDPVLDIHGAFMRQKSIEHYIAAVIGYTLLSVPLQEIVFRGGVQGCLQQIFSGQRNMWRPIVIANIVFATSHIMISPFAAIVIFFPGLYWGWLFARHHNLIGVCLSHAIFGATAFFVIGYYDVLRV